MRTYYDLEGRELRNEAKMASIDSCYIWYYSVSLRRTIIDCIVSSSLTSELGCNIVVKVTRSVEPRLNLVPELSSSVH